MKKFKSLLFVAIVAITFVFTSCEKEDIVDQTVSNVVAFVSGTASVQDGDITLKSAPVAGSRDWYNFYKMAPANSWLLLGKPSTPFLAGSAAENDWVTGANPANLNLGNLLSLTYAPYAYNRIVSVTKGTDGTPMYMGIEDFSFPAHNFSVQMYGRQLKDYLAIDVQDLQVKGYKFTINVGYNLNTIDLNATMTTSGGTFNGWPTYLYNEAVKEAKSFTIVCNANDLVNPLIAPSAPNANGDIVLFDDYGKEITDLVVTYSIEQEIQTPGVPPGVAWAPFKTNEPVVVSAAFGIGQGLSLDFVTDAIGYEGGNVTLIQDVDITVNSETKTLN